MPRPQIITGLDIGTNSIKMLMAVPKDGGPDFEVLSLVEEPAFGVRRGVVIQVDNVANTIQTLLSRIVSETGQKTGSVYVNLGGSHIFSTSSRGTVAVSRADQMVSEEDVTRVLQAAQTFSLPMNKEIFEVIPKEFILDEEKMREVVGLRGVRLETEVLVLAGFSPYKHSLTQSVFGADLKIADVIPSPLAAASAVLSKQQKELGVALLDIGAGTSELAVFEEGNLVHLAVFPIGSSNITSDIAIGLKTDIDTAEQIKISKGSCLLRGRDKKEKVIVEGEGTLVFSQKTLTNIIEARVSEIFDVAQKELKDIGKQGNLPAGIVLTGGGAMLKNIAELARKEFKLPCHIGKLNNFPTLEQNPRLATVCGLVSHGIDIKEGGVIIRGNPLSFPKTGGKLKEKLQKIFKVFIP